MQNGVAKKTSSRINSIGGPNIDKKEFEVNLVNSKKSAIVKFEETLKFINALEIDIDDMQNVEDINQMDLFNNLKNRFLKDVIFTNVGQTLIIVNPYKNLKCFEPDIISNYIATFKKNKEIEKTLASLNKKSILERRVSIASEDFNLFTSTRSSISKRASLSSIRASKLPRFQTLPAHLYNLILGVIDNLQSARKHQTILISGESGAGKTETAKHAIKFITKFFENSKKSRKSIISFEDKSLAISLEDQIQKCNPILEAFGNAKTKNNDNSSRFGKFINIRIDVDSKIIEGAEISTFLLEKTRLVFPGEKERNFHIFYYILKGADDQLIELLNLSRDPKAFNYLKVTGCFEIEKVQDNNQFLELIEAFVFNGFSNQELLYIFRILAAILHLGNVEFEDNVDKEKDKDSKKGSNGDNQSNGSKNDGKNAVRNPDALVRVKDNAEKEILNSIAMLIDIDEYQLEETLTMKTLKIQKEEYKKPLTLQEAYAARDVLAKEIYSRLFNWVVKKLNYNLQQKYKQNPTENTNKNPNTNENQVSNSNQSPNPIINLNTNKHKDEKKENEKSKIKANNSSISNIGILDIFGFESFSVNSFEQFCINFSNEKLQQLFIMDIFKSDEQEFINEGLENVISGFNYKDNKEILDLLEKDKTGIFQILDDTCKLKQQDSNFYNNVISLHANNKNLKINKINKNLLGVNHTAKSIDYTVTGFVNKNFDDASEAIFKNFIVKNKDEEIPMMHLVFFNFLSEEEYKNFLIEYENTNNSNNNNNNFNNKNKSSPQESKFLGYKFRKDFDFLVKEIKESQRHYVRCLKPNEEKLKDVLVSGCIYRQINYLGILDSIKIRKQNFPIRKSYKDFMILCYDFYELLFYKWIYNSGKAKPENIDKINRSLLFPSANKKDTKKIEENANKNDNSNTNPTTISNEEMEKYRRLSLLILSIFFSEEEKNKSFYLIGKTKIFMIDNFLSLIDSKKNIYLIRRINNANKIADTWLKSKLKEKYLKFLFKLGLFALKGFLIKIHFGRICRNKIRSYLCKSFFGQLKQFNKQLGLIRILNVKGFFKKTKSFIKAKKNYEICRANAYHIINNAMDSLINYIRIKAANKIQNHIRGFLAKTKYSDFVSKGRKKGRLIKQENSALKIQKVFRGIKKYKQVKKIRISLRKFSERIKLELYLNKLPKIKINCNVIRRRYIMYALRKRVIRERLEAYLEEERLYYISKKRILEANKDQSIYSSAKNLSPCKNKNLDFYNIDDINNNNEALAMQTKRNNFNQINYNTGKYTNNSNAVFNSNPKLLSIKGISSVNSASNNHLLKLSSLSKLIGENSLQAKQEKVKDFGLPFFDYYQEPKFTLFIKILDYDEMIDTIEVYKSSWLEEFEKLNNDSIKNNCALQIISTAESHSIAINNKHKAYLWGLNNHSQCGIPSSETNPNLLTIDYPIKNPDCAPIIPELNYKDKNVAFINNSSKTCNSFISALAAEDYSILIDESGNAFSFGDNSKSQLILGNELISNQINLITDFPKCVKEIRTTGNSNIILTKEQKLFIFYFASNRDLIQNANRNQNIFKTLNANSKINISSVSCGKNFSVLLTKQGILFSVGEKNSHGELGLGDYVPRKEPEIIKILIDLKEKINQVECGFKHVIARSSIGKIYSWGNNSEGQLGLGINLKRVNKPTQIKFENTLKVTIIQIAAGFRQSYFLDQDREIYFSGYDSFNNSNKEKNEFENNFIENYKIDLTNKKTKNNTYPINLEYRRIFPYLKNDSEFQIVRILTSWNKLFSAFYVTIADVRNVFQKVNNINKINTILDTLAIKWESDINTVNPPFIEPIANYFHSSIMKKIVNNNDNKASLKKLNVK